MTDSALEGVSESRQHRRTADDSQSNQPPTDPSKHKSIYSLILSFTFPLRWADPSTKYQTILIKHSFIHTPVHSPVDPSIYSTILPVTCRSMQSSACSFNYKFIQSFSPLPVYSTIQQSCRRAHHPFLNNTSINAAIQPSTHFFISQSIQSFNNT